MDKQYLLKGFIWFIAAWIFSGCTEDFPLQNEESEEVEVTIQFSTSYPDDVTTRAVILDDEGFNKFKDMFILVYEEQEDGTQRFKYWREADKINQDNSTGKGSFTVKLVKSITNEKYAFDFIVGISSTIIYPMLDTQIPIGSTREYVQQNFSYTGTRSTTSTVEVPKWAGIYEAVPVTHNMSLPTLKFIQCISRIDVGLNLNASYVAQGLDNFSLSYLSYYYGGNHLLYIPAKGTVVDGEVIAPSFFEDYTAMNGGNSANYPLGDNSIFGGVLVHDTNPEIGYNNNKPCLIVGGRYGGSTTMSYYRVDLLDPEDPTKLLAPIRNHRYIVNITGVTGQGFSTAANAAGSYQDSPIASSVTAITAGTNSPGIKYYAYSGRYSIGVTEKYFNLPATLSEQTIGVLSTFYITSTNNGWRLVIRDELGRENIDWITPSTTSWNGITSANNSQKSYPITPMTFTVQANTTGTIRKAYLHYTTYTTYGIEMIVEVTQAGS